MESSNSVNPHQLRHVDPPLHNQHQNQRTMKKDAGAKNVDARREIGKIEKAPKSDVNGEPGRRRRDASGMEVWNPRDLEKTRRRRQRKS